MTMTMRDAGVRLGMAVGEAAAVALGVRRPDDLRMIADTLMSFVQQTDRVQQGIALRVLLDPPEGEGAAWLCSILLLAFADAMTGELRKGRETDEFIDGFREALRSKAAILNSQKGGSQ